MSARLSDAQRRDVGLMAAQGESDERIAQHFGIKPEDVKIPAKSARNRG